MKRVMSAIVLATFMAACGDSVQTTTPKSTGTRADAGTTTSTGGSRLCTDELTIPTPARLASFFQTAVRNLEGPVTFCLKASGSNSSISGSLRIEYEDDFGIRSFDMSQSNVFGGEVTNTDTSTHVDIVFMDGYGFVQAIGDAPSSGNFSGVIKYYNFPTYEEALNEQIQAAQDKCRNGVWTVAQCEGYNFPTTYWWNAPVYTSERQRMIDQAKAILNNPNKTTQLGTISVDVTQIIQ